MCSPALLKGYFRSFIIWGLAYCWQRLLHILLCLVCPKPKAFFFSFLLSSWLTRHSFAFSLASEAHLGFANEGDRFFLPSILRFAPSPTAAKATFGLDGVNPSAEKVHCRGVVVFVHLLWPGIKQSCAERIAGSQRVHCAWLIWPAVANTSHVRIVDFQFEVNSSLGRIFSNQISSSFSEPFTTVAPCLKGNPAKLVKIFPKLLFVHLWAHFHPTIFIGCDLKKSGSLG